MTERQSQHGTKRDKPADFNPDEWEPRSELLGRRSHSKRIGREAVTNALDEKYGAGNEHWFHDVDERTGLGHVLIRKQRNETQEEE